MNVLKLNSYARTIFDFVCEDFDFLTEVTGKKISKDEVAASGEEIINAIEEKYFSDCKTLLRADRITRNIIRSFLNKEEK